MRYLVTGLCLTVVVGFSSAGDEPLTKDGKLAHALKITQLQGGFAGFTGVEYTIEPDGTWATASVFRQKLTPKDKGKLSDKELRAIIGLLAKNEFQKLPAKSGKQPGANPHTITIEYGKFKATLVGQMPPKVDTDNVQSIESRFAAILRGVSGTLNSPDKKVG